MNNLLVFDVRVRQQGLPRIKVAPDRAMIVEPPPVFDHAAVQVADPVVPHEPDAP